MSVTWIHWPVCSGNPETSALQHCWLCNDSTLTKAHLIMSPSCLNPSKVSMLHVDSKHCHEIYNLYWPGVPLPFFRLVSLPHPLHASHAACLATPTAFPASDMRCLHQDFSLLPLEWLALPSSRFRSWLGHHSLTLIQITFLEDHLPLVTFYILWCSFPCIIYIYVIFV